MNTEKFRTLLVLGACSLVGGLLFAPSALAAAPNLSVSITPSDDTQVQAGVPVPSIVTIENTGDQATNAQLAGSLSLINATVQSGPACSGAGTLSGTGL